MEARPRWGEVVITVEESFAAATHYGVAMFPGVDPASWQALTTDERQLVAAVAWRSLIARGAESEPRVREALELASSHDLILVVNTNVDGHTDAQWFAATSDRAVRVQIDESGLVHLSTFAVGGLVDLLLETTPPRAQVTVSCVYRDNGKVLGNETTLVATPDADAVFRTALIELLPNNGAANNN